MENADEAATNTIATIKVGVKDKPETLKKYPIKVDIPPPSLTFDDIYPVGSIYITIEPTFDPNRAFGGTWVRIGKGQCLWGCDPTDENYVSKIGQDIEAGLPNITGTLSDQAKPNTAEPWTFIDAGDLATTGAIKRYPVVSGPHRAVTGTSTT